MLCLALADRSGELQLLQASKGLAAVAPQLAQSAFVWREVGWFASARGLGGVARNCDRKQKGPPGQCRAGQERRVFDVTD